MILYDRHVTRTLYYIQYTVFLKFFSPSTQCLGLSTLTCVQPYCTLGFWPPCFTTATAPVWSWCGTRWRLVSICFSFGLDMFSRQLHVLSIPPSTVSAMFSYDRDKETPIALLSVSHKLSVCLYELIFLFYILFFRYFSLQYWILQNFTASLHWLPCDYIAVPKVKTL